MHAMMLKRLGSPLEWTQLADRQPGPGEIRVKVGACGVCRTDLHVVDGELPDPKVPIIPGHEIVGRIDAIGAEVEGLRLGERVGVPWIEADRLFELGSSPFGEAEGVEKAGVAGLLANCTSEPEMKVGVVGGEMHGLIAFVDRGVPLFESDADAAGEIVGHGLGNA